MSIRNLVASLFPFLAAIKEPDYWLTADKQQTIVPIDEHHMKPQWLAELETRDMFIRYAIDYRMESKSYHTLMAQVYILNQREGKFENVYNMPVACRAGLDPIVLHAQTWETSLQYYKNVFLYMVLSAKQHANDPSHSTKTLNLLDICWDREKNRFQAQLSTIIFPPTQEYVEFVKNLGICTTYLLEARGKIAKHNPHYSTSAAKLDSPLLTVKG